MNPDSHAESLRFTYDFTDEPTDEVYANLLRFAVPRCRIAQVVTREAAPSTGAANALAQMSTYLDGSERAYAWPGTTLLPSNGVEAATLWRYRWSGGLVDIVLQFSHGLFQWQAPSLPEDLALLRKPGDVWLGSVAHEGDAWLELTEAEHSGLVASIPDIGALLAKPRRTGTEVPSDDPTWRNLTANFRTRDRVPAAQAIAKLLDATEPRWGGILIARGSMHDALFTVPGELFPAPQTVRVSWADGVFEFKLVRDGCLVTADRCFEANSIPVLEAFLTQLAGPSSPI
jgi:hypothetical protein